MRTLRPISAYTAILHASPIFAIIFSALFIGSAGMMPVQATGANTWTVNVLTDNGLTTCIANAGAGGAACELRDAINKAASGDTVNFTGLSGTITIYSTLTIGISVTIAGPGASSLAIDGNHAETVFAINSGAAVSISGLTIQNGVGPANGGGIYNNGTLTVDRSTISNNVAQNWGGGIYNAGTMIVSNSTVSGNQAASGSLVTPGLNGGGGGVNNTNTITISNSTISDNSTSGKGGGLYNAIFHDMTVSNTTISNNSASVGVGGLYNDLWSNLNLLSVVSANNVNGDFYWNYGGGGTPNPITSLGHNLIGIQTGIAGLTNGYKGDQIGSVSTPIDAKLTNLASNGSSTMTDALLVGSPAIGNGDCSGANATEYAPAAPAVTTDQRGVARGNPCDVGAFEGSVVPTATSTATPSSTNTATATSTATSTATATLGGGGSTATAIAASAFPITETAIQKTINAKTATLTFIPPSPTALPAYHTIGVYRGGTFYLRLHNTTGNADITVAFNPPGKNLPVSGDWINFGFDTIGVFDQNTANFRLCTVNDTSGCAQTANQIAFTFGNPNDLPLAGRWTYTNPLAGVGVFRPGNGLIYLKTLLTSGFADYAMVMGIPGDSGIAGDWTGKGYASPGVFRPGNVTVYLSNQVTNGPVYADISFQFGASTDIPITGDWSGQWHDSVGMFRPGNGTVYLKNALTTGFADNTFAYGMAGDQPVVGYWSATYPPIAPAPILITKTAAPGQSNLSVPGNNRIGE